MSAPDTPLPASAVFAFGRYRLDPLRAELRRDGEAVTLRRKAFDLLLAFAPPSRPGAW